jgi:rhamnosyltransferase
MSQQIHHIVAVIVTYQPSLDLLYQNFLALRQQVSHVVVIDNTDHPEQAACVEKRLKDHPELHYVWNQGNQGIAHALNQGVRLAESLGADWILTMDQDSILPPDYVSILANEIAQHDDSVISIGTPFVSHHHTFADTKDGGEVKLLITSGNLIQIAAIKKAAYFREEFFIDYVDFDLSLRLRKLGYQLIETHKTSFTHHLGEPEKKVLFGKTFSCTNYSPLRFYYMTRNRLVFFKENCWFDPALVMRCTGQMLKEIVKMLLAENDRKRKIKAILTGIKDGLFANMGKYAGKF